MTQTISQARRGRPATISRDAILDAAERRSFGELSLQALAGELGVTPAALYRYFPSKADLARALRARVAGADRVPARDGRPWRDWMMAAAQALRAYVRHDRISAGVLQEDVAMHPLVEAIAEVLAEAGFSPRASWDLYMRLCAIALGAASFEANVARHGEPTAAAMRAQLGERDMDPNGAFGRMLISAAAFDVDDWFRDEVAQALASR